MIGTVHEGLDSAPERLFRCDCILEGHKLKKRQQADWIIMYMGIVVAISGTYMMAAQRQTSEMFHSLGYKQPEMSPFSKWGGPFLIVLGLSYVVWAVIMMTRRKRKLEAERQRARDLATNRIELDVEEFLAMIDPQEFTGVYILHNVTKDMYYVGQSARVNQRVRQHFTGHGNGDVYADYKYGDDFTVRAIAMEGSGYMSIDALECDMIDVYSAFESGYNKTCGNGRG